MLRHATEGRFVERSLEAAFKSPNRKMGIVHAIHRSAKRAIHREVKDDDGPLRRLGGSL